MMNYVYLLVCFIVFPVSWVFAGAQPGDEKIQCFTCWDKEQCSNLMTIYQTNDKKLYSRDDQTVPECNAISPPPPMKCSVCRAQTTIGIICSGDVGELEVESSVGVQISNVSLGCSFRFPGEDPQSSSHPGFITSSDLFLIGLGLLLTQI